MKKNVDAFYAITVLSSALIYVYFVSCLHGNTNLLISEYYHKSSFLKHKELCKRFSIVYDIK